MGDWVSIPLRYAKNARFERHGRGVYEFQFLLGTLKTADAVDRYEELTAFQFLLGTLKTARISLTVIRQTPVSIPLRYAKNLHPVHF
mgnify:FL=1